MGVTVVQSKNWGKGIQLGGVQKLQNLNVITKMLSFGLVIIHFLIRSPKSFKICKLSKNWRIYEFLIYMCLKTYQNCAANGYSYLIKWAKVAERPIISTLSKGNFLPVVEWAKTGFPRISRHTSHTSGLHSALSKFLMRHQMLHVVEQISRHGFSSLLDCNRLYECWN